MRERGAYKTELENADVSSSSISLSVDRFDDTIAECPVTRHATTVYDFLPSEQTMAPMLIRVCVTIS